MRARARTLVFTPCNDGFLPIIALASAGSALSAAAAGRRTVTSTHCPTAGWDATGHAMACSRSGYSRPLVTPELSARLDLRTAQLSVVAVSPSGAPRRARRAVLGAIWHL